MCNICARVFYDGLSCDESADVSLFPEPGNDRECHESADIKEAFCLLVAACQPPTQ